MDVSKILNSDYLDILFDGRNKQYGGYELRKNYPKRMLNALMVIGAIALLTIAYGVAAKLMGAPKEKKVVSIQEVKLAEPPPIDKTKPPPPPPPPKPPPPVKPTVKFTPPVIKKNEEVKEEEKPPPKEELKDKVVSTVTAKGDVNGIDPGIVDKPAATGPVEPAADPKKVFTYVEQEAHFNGNMNSWLSDHLQYPESDKEAGNEGKTIVRFIVNADGSVEDIEISKSSGFPNLDAEAKRAVSKMPKWTPGKQKGNPVRSYFQVPITFALES